MDEQLIIYLRDVHSIEKQALAQLRPAPAIAGDDAIAEALREHEAETEEHERLIRARLEAHGARPSMLKDAAGVASGPAFVLFAKLQPDTPGKLVAHAFSYEHMELAAHDILARVADAAGDAETADVARRIREEERAMADRLASLFDTAVEASLAEKGADDAASELPGYLTDAHAIESQSVGLLERARKTGGLPALEELYQSHLEESRDQQRLIAERLEALGESPSRLKDAAMKLGSLNWAAFFAAQPDTPAKLAGFAYAFEHLEIAGYELLARVARRASDEATVSLCEHALAEERVMASRLTGLFDEATEASLEEAGASR